MPNIELYGFEKAKKVVNEIAKIIKENFPDEANDTVITIIKSRVIDLQGKKRPYVRVLHISNKKAEAMAQVLSSHFEAEALALGNFFDAKLHRT